MERIDDLVINNLKIIQNTDWFCYGTDAVLLANFAHIVPGETAVDLCSGNGIIPILLSAKSKAKKIIGVEIQPECVSLAKRSTELNNLSDKIEFIQCDIKNVSEYFDAESVASVTCNPPYMNGDWGFVSPTDIKAVARHEILMNLDDLMKASSYLLKFGGYFNMVHRAERLCDIFFSMRKYNIEPKRVLFVHSKIDKAPKLVLIEGMKGAKPSMKILDPLCIYDSDGNFSEQYNQFVKGKEK